MNAIHIDAYLNCMWLQFQHLAKVPAWRCCFAESTQALPKQKINKDTAVCISVCFDVVVAFNHYQFFNRCGSCPSNKKGLSRSKHFELFKFFCQSSCICISNSWVSSKAVYVLFKKTSDDKKITMRQWNNENAAVMHMADRSGHGHLKLVCVHAELIKSCTWNIATLNQRILQVWYFPLKEYL